MFRRLALLVLVLRWPLALALALMTLVMGDSVLRLQIDPSTESLFSKTSEDYLKYQEVHQEFGSDSIVAVAMATPNLFSGPYLEILRTLTKAIEEYPQVERVISLANANDIRHRFLGAKVVPALQDVYNGTKKAADVRRNILRNELYRNNLVSTDGKIANILVYLKPAFEDKSRAGAFIKDLNRLLRSFKQEKMTFYVAGSPVEQYEFIRLLRRDQFVFVPIITLLLILTTWAIYRHVACMVLSMSVVFTTLIWSLGTIHLLGQQLNLVTSLLAPVIMIVAVVSSIHLMNLFFEMRHSHPSLRESVALTMSELGMPNFLTHFTTILGFLSLLLNPVPAIQSFGLFAAIGTFYSYANQLILTPLLLPILPYRPKPETKKEHFFNVFLVRYLEKIELSGKWFIFLATFVLIGLSVMGLRQLQVDTNLIKQMKPEQPLAVATRFIDEHLTGIYALSFVFQRVDGGKMTDRETLQKIDDIKQFIEEQPEIANVHSLTTLVKRIHQAVEGEESAYSIPDDDERLEDYLRGIFETADPDIRKLISSDLKKIRLEARMKAVGTQQGNLMEERVRRFLDENVKGDLQYTLTGNVVLLGKMAKNLVVNQMKGFLFAFLSILFVIVVTFRSLRLGLLAAIPNLIPILALYGLMGWIGIELSTPTAMISSIVLGLVVDSSIHFLHRYRLEFRKRRHYLQALHHTFRNVGQSLVMSTFILCTGFASSLFASFRPTIYFGALTSLTILFALICTLVILPVCVMIVKPFGRPHLFRKTGPA